MAARPKELPKCRTCSEGKPIIFRLENGECGHCEYLTPSKPVVDALKRRVKHPCCCCGHPLFYLHNVYACDNCSHSQCLKCRQLDTEVTTLRNKYKEKGTYSRKPKQLRPS